MRDFLRRNGLSLVMFALFLIFAIGLCSFGVRGIYRVLTAQETRS